MFSMYYELFEAILESLGILSGKKSHCNSKKISFTETVDTGLKNTHKGSTSF